MKTYQKLNINLKGVNDEKKTLNVVFSTADEDRHGDVVEQNWELKNFLANPVILNSHSYGDATEVIGRALPETVRVVDGKLEGTIQFAVDENPKAKIIYDLYKGKFLNAFSVGFIPKAFDEEGKILLSELLELSAVAVPANQMALAKSAGIEVNKLMPNNEAVSELKEKIKTLEETLSELCESKKVETRSVEKPRSSDRAEVRRNINKSMRLLTKLKQRI